MGFFGWGGFEIGVGRANFETGLGVGPGIEALRWPILKFERPTPVAVQLVGQVVQLERLGQPIEVPEKKGFGDWLASFTTRRAARISVFEIACGGMKL